MHFWRSKSLLDNLKSVFNAFGRKPSLGTLTKCILNLYVYFQKQKNLQVERGRLTWFASFRLHWLIQLIKAYIKLLEKLHSVNKREFLSNISKMPALANCCKAIGKSNTTCCLKLHWSGTGYLCELCLKYENFKVLISSFRKHSVFWTQVQNHKETHYWAVANSALESKWLEKKFRTFEKKNTSPSLVFPN